MTTTTTVAVVVVVVVITQLSINQNTFMWRHMSRTNQILSADVYCRQYQTVHFLYYAQKG